VLGEGAVFEDLSQAFDQAYEAGMSDEFIEPCVASKNGKPVAMVQDNDSIIYFNHRSDRARQLTKAFTQPDFTDLNPGSFKLKKRVANLRFVAMTDFGPDLGNILTAYPSVDVEQALPKVLSKKKQIYIAETEKYAHMTYFFNGGYADPVGNEERAMVPSPKVARYDEAPGMSTGLITDTVIRCLTKGGYDFVAANFACLDMVAHTGDFAAAKQALHAVDEQIGRIMIAVRSCGAILMVTADHGNIEEMKDLSSKSIDTEHSKNQVPFLLWNAGSQYTKLRAEGLLGDVAPTIIGLFGLRVPEQMTGTSLIVR